MSSKLVKIGSLFLTGTLASIGATAHADNINTSGVICHNFQAAEALDIDYLTNGVQDVNTAARRIICTVPRSPLAATTPAQFFVDGLNTANTITTCTLTAYTFFGAPVTSSTFSEPAIPGASVTWDHLVTFPAGTLGTFDYVSVLCNIPGSRNGTLFGVTAVQP